MSIFKHFIKRNRISGELKDLNAACNLQFNEIFYRCRLVYGRELVEIMNYKSAIFETLEKNGNDRIREKVALKFLNLASLYFKLLFEFIDAKGYAKNVDVMAGRVDADYPTDTVNTLKAKLDKAYELLTSLHRQFFLVITEDLSIDAFDNTIKEAEALCNAINIQYGEKRGE